MRMRVWLLAALLTVGAAQGCAYPIGYLLDPLEEKGWIKRPGAARYWELKRAEEAAAARERELPVPAPSPSVVQ